MTASLPVIAVINNVAITSGATVEDMRVQIGALNNIADKETLLRTVGDAHETAGGNFFRTIIALLLNLGADPLRDMLKGTWADSKDSRRQYATSVIKMAEKLRTVDGADKLPVLSAMSTLRTRYNTIMEAEKKERAAYSTAKATAGKETTNQDGSTGTQGTYEAPTKDAAPATRALSLDVLESFAEQVDSVAVSASAAAKNKTLKVAELRAQLEALALALDMQTAKLRAALAPFTPEETAAPETVTDEIRELLAA